MESEGLVALVVPKTGVTTWALLGGALASSSAGNPFPPTASNKKTDHVSRKQLSEQTPGNLFSQTASKNNHISRKQSYELISKPKQAKPKMRSRSNADHERVDKSRQYFEKRLKKNYDIRYINSLRTYLDKFIESSKPVACDQLECPSLQARLHQHRNQHHSRDQMQRVPGTCCKTRKHDKCRAANEACCHKDTRDVTKRSPNGYTKKSTASEESKGSHSVQTKITFADIGNLTISIEPEGVPASRNDAETDKTVNLKFINAHNFGQTQSRTRSNIECDKTGYFYKDNLKDEINKWMLFVPFYPNTTPKSQLEKDNTIDKLVKRICELVTEVDNPNYQQMIAYEIYQCIDDLKIWYPGAKRNQSLFKEGLCLNLWNAIKDVNDKWLGYRNYSSQQSKRHPNCDVNKCRMRTTCDSESTGYTINSHRICDRNVKTRKRNCSHKNISCKDYLNYEISDWLTNSNLYLPDSTGMSKRTITNILLNRLQPYLNEPMTDKNKNILRSKIVEILEELPISLNCPGNTGLLTKFADNLTNRLLGIRAKFECHKCKKSVDRTNLQCITQKPEKRENIRKQDFLDELRDCLTNSHINNQKFIEEEILDIILDNMESIRNGKVQDVESDILILLQESEELTRAEMANIVKCVVNNIKNVVLDEDDIILRSSDSTSLLKPCNSAILSIYTSEHELVRTFITPVNSNKSLKRQASEKNINLNKVTKIINNWIERLPLKTKTDEKHKKTIIDGLVEAITDQTVLEQIAVEQKTDINSAKKYLIKQFLANLYLTEENKTEHHVLELLNKLKETSTSAKSFLKWKEGEASSSLEYFVSKTGDSLQNVITTWVNEQPSQIYSIDDTKYRNEKIQDLTTKLQPLVENNKPDKEKSVVIAEWLQEMVADQDRKKINAMAVNLIERLKKVPLEETAVVEAKLFAAQKNLHTASDKIKKMELAVAINKSTSYPNALDTYKKDPDETMKELIMKFIQHNSDVEDRTARSAFAELLETEIEKLSAPSRRELYDGFLKSPQKHFSPIRLDRELKYIKDITDWLKNIPIESTYNAKGNKKRIDFCLRLAGDMASVESDRLYHDDDNNNNLEAIIGKYMTQLPIHPNQHANISRMIHQLLNKIILTRQKLATAEEKYALTNPHPNLTDFIEDYIRINGREIAEDDLKLEAWSDRLLKEVKQITCAHDPAAFTKNGVYHRLAEQKPEETVKDFNIKLDYAKEISDWMKNLPLLHTIDDSKAHLTKELAEKIAETKRKKAFNPNDVQADVDLENYIINWIPKLPLDRTKEVIIPIVIKQLTNRVEKVNISNRSVDNVIGVPKTECCSSGNSTSRSDLSNSISNKSPKDNVIGVPKIECCSSGTPRVNSPSPSTSRSDLSNSTSNKSPKDNVIGVSKIECCSLRTARDNLPSPLSSRSNLSNLSSQKSPKSPKSQWMPGQHHPASWIVKSVEDWTANLPIEGGNEKDIKAVKTDIAKKLYQKMGELNVNQRFNKDTVLYNDVISDEIDAQLEKLPHNMMLKGDKNKIKEGLLQTIADSKRKINENTAGESYKHRLENTIESSMPHPLQIQNQDIGFEIYKNRLASMFILENFDHGNEVSKHKYEKHLKREIDKYFKNAQSKNGILLTKDQIYNELYSSLYKVPKPNKTSLLEEVEEIKIKCEIDDWFEELPLKRPVEVSELLQWNKISSTLAKRLHEMENDPKPNDNRHKEITKWLTKLPIQPGKDIDKLADKLEIKLKSVYQYAQEQANILSCDKKCPVNSINNIEDYPNSYDNSRNLSAKPIPKKSADLTIEIIEDWCNQLPIPTNTTLKGDLVTKIIIKVSELNSDPRIFNDDLLYNYLLDKELDKIISTLPDSSDLRRSKGERKYKLIEGLDSIKVLIREERARHEYRNDLNDTIMYILQISTSNTPEKTTLFNNFRDEVVDDFVEYYHRDDDAGKHYFKKKIHNAMTEYMQKITDDKDRSNIPNDSMVKGNQLLCELSKVPLPTEAAVTEEVQEIRMKKQVREFFDTVLKDSKDKKGLGNQVQTSLAKRLNEIEKTGHNIENNKKIKREITRSLRKLGHEISSQKIDQFIDKLKLNEMTRKTPLIRKYDSYPVHSNIPDWVNDSVRSKLIQIQKCCDLPNCLRSRKIQEQIDQTLQSLLSFSNALQQQPRSSGHPGPSDQARPDPYHQILGSRSEHFISSSRSRASQYNEPVGNNSSRRFDDSMSPLAQAVSNVSGSLREYSQFEDEVARNSSKIHSQGSFIPQATSGAFQRSFSSPCAGACRGRQWQQSIGPSDGSGNQWQSMSSSGGPQQSVTSQGPMIPVTSGGLVPPRGLNSSMSPYSNYEQRPVGTPGTIPQPVQQSFCPASCNDSQWLSSISFPEPQPAGSMPRQAGQQTFSPASGSGSHWESLSASPEQGQGSMQPYPGQQSFGPVLGSGSQWYFQSEIPRQVQSSFVQPDAGIVPIRSSLGSQHQSFGPETGSDTQLQSFYSTLEPTQLETDQDIAQSSRRLFPPQVLETSTSPYTSSIQQPISGPLRSGQSQKQFRWYDQNSFRPSGTDLVPRISSLGGQQRSFGPTSGNGSQWHFQNRTPSQVQSSFIPSDTGVVQRGSTLGGQQQSFGPASGSGSQWQFQNRTPSQVQNSFVPSDAGVVPRRSSLGGQHQSFDLESGNGSQWHFQNKTPSQVKSFFIPSDTGVVRESSVERQQSFGPEPAQYNSLYSTTGPSQLETDQGMAQSSRRLFPPETVDTSTSPYTNSSQQPLSGPPSQQDAGRAGGPQPLGPASADNAQWQSQNEIPGHVQSSFGPPGTGVVPRGLSFGGQQQSFDPEPGSDAQWQSLYSTLGPQQLGTDPGSVQSGAGVVPMGPNFGQEQSFGAETGSVGQWLPSCSSDPHQRCSDQCRPARLVPPRNLEKSTSPYATNLYPPRGLETSASPYAIGPSEQRSARSGQWVYHEPYVDPQSSSNVVYGPQSQGGVVDSLSESALGYPGFVNEVPLSSSRLNQLSRSFIPPSGIPSMQNQSAVSAARQSFVSGQWEPRGSVRQLPPSNTMYPSGGSVQAWDTQSSAGPQVVQQRAQAMVHEQRDTLGPQIQDQILHDPYVSRQYGPGDVQSLQRFSGVQASLGQSGIDYQGFQAAGPISSSLRQSLAPSQRTLSSSQGFSPSFAQRSMTRGGFSPSSIVQQPSPSQAYESQIPLIRSPQSTPSLPPTPQYSYRSPGPQRSVMHAPGLRHVDSTLIGPYLSSPASVPQISGEIKPMTTEQGLPQDYVMSDIKCICERQTRARKCRPIHAIPLLEFCESCQDFAPFFRPMPFPGYFF